MQEDTKERVAQIAGALSSLRVPAVPGEYDLHAQVADALTRAGIAFEHEKRLAPRSRVDFVALGVALEIKKGHVPAKRLRAQAQKYLEQDAIDALMLLTTDGAALPASIAGKPVIVFGLNRLWGVALP